GEGRATGPTPLLALPRKGGGNTPSLRREHPAQIAFNPFSISLRRPSRNGGSTSFSPSRSIGSSTPKPGPSEAISNRMPFGSRKYRLRNQKRSTLPLLATRSLFSRSAQPSYSASGVRNAT